MKKITICILINFMLLSCSNHSMDVVFNPKSSAEIIDKGTTSVFEFVTSNENAKIRKIKNRIYYWYDNHKIHSSQFHFSGKLLDGKYEQRFPDGNLKTRGKFKFGLKEEQWFYYHPNGKVKKIENWKKGLLIGQTEIYDHKSQLIQTISYKNGKKHGKEIFYHADTIRFMIKYRQGKPKIKRTEKTQ